MTVPLASPPGFFAAAQGLTLESLGLLLKAEVRKLGADADRILTGVAALDAAGPADISFFEHRRYTDDLLATQAGACLVTERHAALVPNGTAALVVKNPQHAFVTVARHLFASALRPSPVFGAEGLSHAAHIHPTARLEDNVTVEPGAVIGPQAQIGSGTLVGANAVIGSAVTIGRDCSIGPGASLLHCHLGNRVIIHPGARLGQDGFGYQGTAKGHVKIPQVGRVIVQDDAEIGAGTTIDRGGIRDTVIGEGTKIDNLVQVGHNVIVGRHCIIVSRVCLAGSVTLGDFVVLGGAVLVNNHLTIGDGAQIAATSLVHEDVPPGAVMGGWPIQPMRDWLREVAQRRRKPVEKPSEEGSEPS